MNDLTDKQKQWAAWGIVALVLTIVSIFLGVSYPVPEPPTFVSPLDDQIIALGTTHFTNIEAEDITATDDLAVTDDASVGGALSVTGDQTLSAGLIATKATTQTIAYGSTISTTLLYYPLNSAGTITNATLVDGSTAGQLLLLQNRGANAIGIAESTNLKAGGAVTLGADEDDIVLFVWDGEDWIQVSKSDN